MIGERKEILPNEIPGIVEEWLRRVVRFEGIIVEKCCNEGPMPLDKDVAVWWRDGWTDIDINVYSQCRNDLLERGLGAMDLARLDGGSILHCYHFSQDVECMQRMLSRREYYAKA